MSKRFVLKNKLWVIIASIVVSIILLACCVVNILQLCEIPPFRTYNVPATILATVVSAIVIVLILINAFASGYTFTKKGVMINIGAIFYTTPYEKILKARTNEDKTILILYVETDKGGDVVDEESGISADISQINISPNKVDAFITCLKEQNKNIIYEIYRDENLENSQKKNHKDSKEK